VGKARFFFVQQHWGVGKVRFRSGIQVEVEAKAKVNRVSYKKG